MGDKILDYLKNIPLRKRLPVLAVIIAGIVLPVIFIASLLSTHGSIDFFNDSAPVRTAFLFVGCLGLLVLIAAIADLVIQSYYQGVRTRLPFVATLIIASISIVVTAGLTAYIVIPQAVRTGDTPPQLILTPANDNTGNAGIAIVFRTDKPTVNTVEWGPMGRVSCVLIEERPSHHHWFPLTPLEPETIYSYSVNGGEVIEFKSFPSANKPLRFATAGDPHFGSSNSDNDRTREMLRLIKDPASGYSMLFVLGDLVDLGFIDGYWKQAFSAIASCSSTIPTYYVIGNHDTLFGGLNLYRDYLCPPDSNGKKVDCLWQRIDYNNIHFLILDIEWELEAYTATQQKWLLEQLQSIPPEDWCIVMSHTFYYGSGSIIYGWQWYDNQKTIEALAPLFEQYNVDLVLSGHKHHSEVLQKNGVTYVIMGSFGGQPDPERDYISPASVWYRSGGYAFTDVTIDNQTANIVVRDPENRELFKTIIQNRE